MGLGAEDLQPEVGIVAKMVAIAVESYDAWLIKLSDIVRIYC